MTINFFMSVRENSLNLQNEASKLYVTPEEADGL